MQFAFSSVAEAVTKGDNRAGFELLREDPWRGMHFTSGIRGYTAGLGRRTDWRQVSTDLLGLVTERFDALAVADVEGKQELAERASVNQVVAHAWARRDLDAAIEWYSSTIPQESMVERRILALLSSLTALSFLPFLRPPANSNSSLKGVPIGTSKLAGFLTLPVTEKHFVPPEFSTPRSANHFPPRERISGTEAKLSVLLIVVGLPYNPTLAG